MKKLLIIFIILVLFSNFVIAQEFDEAITLIQTKVPCNKLTDAQLEVIGDYVMEQMHPGQLHEIMDERMGGEGSESLKQVHINMAKTFYCGEKNVMPMSMMNTMMNRGGFNMYNMMGYSSLGYGFSFFGWIFMLAFWVAIIWLIVWIIKQISQRNQNASEILARRFAKGEISKKEYEEIKKTLRR